MRITLRQFFEIAEKTFSDAQWDSELRIEIPKGGKSQFFSADLGFDTFLLEEGIPTIRLNEKVAIQEPATDHEVAEYISSQLILRMNDENARTHF